jgi:hypothetical protein
MNVLSIASSFCYSILHCLIKLASAKGNATKKGRQRIIMRLSNINLPQQTGVNITYMCVCAE